MPGVRILAHGRDRTFDVTAEDQERLRRLTRDRNTPQKVVWRARIVLLAGEGIGAVDVGREVGVSVLTFAVGDDATATWGLKDS